MRDCLLRFYGEQDVWAFGKVCEAINNCTTEESGGSREYCVKVDKNNIIICPKTSEFKEKSKGEGVADKTNHGKIKEVIAEMQNYAEYVDALNGKSLYSAAEVANIVSGYAHKCRKSIEKKAR